MGKVHFRIRPCFQLRQPRKLGTVIRCDRAEYLTEVISQFGLHLLKGIPYRISGFIRQADNGEISCFPFQQGQKNLVFSGLLPDDQVGFVVVVSSIMRKIDYGSGRNLLQGDGIPPLGYDSAGRA